MGGAFSLPAQPVAMPTGAQAVDDGGGCGVVDDVGAVVEVVQVVPTIEAPEAEDMVQDQVLPGAGVWEWTGEQKDRWTQRTTDRHTGLPPPLASS